MEKKSEPSDKNSIKEKISLLKQLIDSLEQAEEKLENYHRKEDVERLNKAKRFILEINKKISEVLE